LHTEVRQALDLLSERAQVLSICLTDRQIELFAEYITHLGRYNEHTNLVSDAQPQTVAINHILDSLTVMSAMESCLRTGRRSLIDVGSGAGFPGLVLSIMDSELEVALVDSVEKKARFLETVVDRLGLKNTHVFDARAEDLAQQRRHREQYDFAVARAVGTAQMVLELTLPLLSKGGLLILQKSLAQADEEARQAAKVAEILGGRLKGVTELDGRLLEKERVLILVEKLQATDIKYPRSWKKIKERPLGSA
jgi:16S rRNA (guanine527-N7)-methyltransferase